jgi:hypothetical protein
MLISVTLTLMLMWGVAEIFSVVANSVNDSRSILGMSDRLRATKARLMMDLDGVTAPMNPPLSPGDNYGYWELIEGYAGAHNPLSSCAINTDEGTEDTTAIDYDDRIIFTTQTMTNEPFIGRSGGGTMESRFAEVAWFVRGRTLYRRVKLIRPDRSPIAFNGGTFDSSYDLSARLEGDPANPGTWAWIPNSLGDLTKRENRMYHLPVNPATKQAYLAANFPYNLYVIQDWQILGFPTLGETSNSQWMLDFTGGTFSGGTLTSIDPTKTDPQKPDMGEIDFWREPYPYEELDPVTGNLTAYQGSRLGEDVILTNVIGFDVKVWDPRAPILSYQNQAIEPGDPGFGAAYAAKVASGSWNPIDYGAFVDLGYGVPLGAPADLSDFSDNPEDKSGFQIASNKYTYIYDTWSTHYENGGLSQNGLDDDPDGAGPLVANGIVDDAEELTTLPPYPVPLKAIQIKIRVFEPESRQIREVTIVHRFSKK